MAKTVVSILCFSVDASLLGELPMKIQKKLNATMVLVLVCLVLVIASSYAWLTLSLQPKVYSIDTNVGANGSLEIALLTEQTHADPLQIRTNVGDSAAEQDALESNKSWGNVIELNDERYGLEKITLLPARLNVTENEGEFSVSPNLLKTADFGIDGRITILSEQTVSTILSDKHFTYYADRQLYGVRAIGSISSLTAQQTALAQARSLAKSYTATAARTVKHTWRDQGSGIMDIFFRRYSAGSDTYTAADMTAIREMANGMLEAMNYVDAALRQGIIGMAASQIGDEPDFENIRDNVENTETPLSKIVVMLGSGAPEEFKSWAEQIDEMKEDLQTVLVNSYALADGGSWDKIEPMLDVLLDADKAYLGDNVLASKAAFESMTEDNEIVLSPDSGIMAGIAAYAGNYSAFSMWMDTVSAEVRTADPNEPAHLLRVEEILEGCKAASGGWTRANMDDIYGFAVDLAFRCNEPSELLLQTVSRLRVNENSEIPVTQGSGSYMRFSSENMDTEQLLQLMDTIRVGFLSDRNTLLGVAKLNISNYEEQEEGILAPLYLYEYTLETDGSLSIGARRSEDASILTLPQNSPVIVTVVVWLDGDHIDNSMVGHSEEQSMDGVLNLQFASSADLFSSDQTIKD